jgi:hypothetical protein
LSQSGGAAARAEEAAVDAQPLMRLLSIAEWLRANLPENDPEHAAQMTLADAECAALPAMTLGEGLQGGTPQGAHGMTMLHVQLPALCILLEGELPLGGSSMRGIGNQREQAAAFGEAGIDHRERDTPALVRGGQKRGEQLPSLGLLRGMLQLAFGRLRQSE